MLGVCAQGEGLAGPHSAGVKLQPTRLCPEGHTHTVLGIGMWQLLVSIIAYAEQVFSIKRFFL